MAIRQKLTQIWSQHKEPLLAGGVLGATALIAASQFFYDVHFHALRREFPGSTCPERTRQALLANPGIKESYFDQNNLSTARGVNAIRFACLIEARTDAVRGIQNAPTRPQDSAPAPKAAKG